MSDRTRKRSSRVAQKRPFQDLSRAGESRFVGYSYDPQMPARRAVVEILLDGEPSALIRADRFRQDLYDSGFGDGCFGFFYEPAVRDIAGRSVLQARLANTDKAVGEPIDLRGEGPREALASASAGTIEWPGGLRLIGTVRVGSRLPVPVVRAYSGVNLVAEVRPRRWAASDAHPDPDEATFEIRLPEALADGCVREIRVETAGGIELDGSPVPIVAFRDGLLEHLRETGGPLSEAERGRWFERLLPASVPFQAFERWRERFCSHEEKTTTRDAIRVVLIGDVGVDDAVQRLSEQTHKHWSGASVPTGDTLCEFDWSDFGAAIRLDIEDEEIAVFTSSATVLAPDALSRIADALGAHPGAVAAYGDLEVRHNGTVHPVFFGQFDYERMLEQGYAARLFAVSLRALDIPDEDTTGSLESLFFAILDQAGPEGAHAVVHVPGLLGRVEEDPTERAAALRKAVSAHLARRGVPAQVTVRQGDLFPAVQVRRLTEASQTVSIVIPTRDRLELLERCVESIRIQTRHVRYEIILVDNGSVTKEAKAYLTRFAGQRHGSVVSAPGHFNYSRLNNLGARSAQGDLLCLLNNDTEIIDPEWLIELASRLSEPTTGAVAPVLLWPNRLVQHGGVVLGTNFAASNAFNDCMADDAGYGDLLRVAHESSAATAACLLVRRADYGTLGGFDEAAFPVLFNDVDFCLKLRRAGKRIVVTPHTQLIHLEAASRGDDRRPDQLARYRRELAALRARWGEVLAADPYYSPFLNLDPYPYSGLAWPPRHRQSEAREGREK